MYLLSLVITSLIVTLTSMVGLAFAFGPKRESRTYAFVTALAVLLAIQWVTLPGEFTSDDDDYANGFLLIAFFYSVFISWLASAISLILLDRPADWIAEQIRSRTGDDGRDSLE